MFIIFGLIDVYSLVVLAAVVISWIPDWRDTSVAHWLGKVTEPLLGPIRRVVPLVGGFDLSPMVLLVALHFLKRLLAALL
jgi:YggT family protein